MSQFLSKFLLIFLMVCIPLQGIAIEAKAAAHQDAIAALAMAQYGEMVAEGHDCCPHGHGDHDPMDYGQSPTPHSAGGDCSHCPLCSVSAPSTVSLMLFSDASPALYPTPALHISSFYPELPKRPPLFQRS